MTLTELPDVLTIRQVCAVFQISDRQYRRLREHGAWPIPALPNFPKRFSKAIVQQFIESGGRHRLARVS